MKDKIAYGIILIIFSAVIAFVFETLFLLSSYVTAGVCNG